MFDVSRDPRSADAYKTFCEKRHDFISKDNFVLNEGEILLECLPSFINEIKSAMVETALNDLKAFLTEAFSLKTDSANTFKLNTKIKKFASGNKREHAISVTEDSIEITGASEWGVASGLYHLQRLLRLHSAPILKRGSFSSVPSLDPSLAYLAFKREITTDFDFPEAYNENYLLRIARAGYTGFHLNLSTSMFSYSSIYTELNNPASAENLETLKKIISIAKKCSLEVFLSYYTVPLKKEHEIFEKFPDMRGSRIVNTDSLHPLCTSSSNTLKYYCEHFENLFTEAKGLAGVFLIVGCEGFLHCFTASELDREQKCTCPECGEKAPEKTVSYLMNKIAEVIKNTAPEALCVIWTYGIHTWTNDKGANFVSLLSKDCEVMTNFDTGDNFKLEGAEGNCFDYSLRCIGPGKMFKKHAEIAKRKSVRLLSKSESGTSLEFYNFPSIPANTRWGKKYANILKHASGAMFNWKFMGFTGEISQELAGWMSWKGYDDYEFLLRKIAERDFGSENVSGLLNAWDCFDKAMDFHPFSIGTAGYFKGPFYIAFTHPLILHPMNPGDLCEEFWGPWDASHLIEKCRKVRFVTDLSWVQPFGAEACLNALMKMENLWAKGCAMIPANSRTEKHLALTVGMLCMIRTSINMINFFTIRDSLFSEKRDKKTFRKKLEKLRDIAKDEYENTLTGLNCMDKNPMLGFQYTYRYTFTRGMCESKLEHTKKLIEQSIPYMWYCSRFSLGKKAEWLW